jgi:hypothetical protein
MDMLSQGRIILCLLIIIIINSSCNPSLKKLEILYISKSKSVVNNKDYQVIFNNMSDSLKIWNLNKLSNYDITQLYFYHLDSLICFNSKGNRAISCIHIFGNQFNSTSDNLIWFYGEKIDNKWYFFKGANLVLPRSLYIKNIKTPLSYQQLHDIALTEIFSAYLTKNGEINEAWFDSHFEGPGWGNFKNQESADEFLNLNGRRFIDKRKFFEAIHLQSVKNNWNGFHKDTIKSLP